jgi:transposase
MRTAERQLAALAARCPTAAPANGPGVGLLTATALVALVADIRRFPQGGILQLPRRHLGKSSGSRRRLGAISKQGDVYVRMLLTHGARSVVWHARRRPRRPATVGRGHRAAARAQRRGRGVANKPRIVWAVGQQRPFAAEPAG